MNSIVLYHKKKADEGDVDQMFEYACLVCFGKGVAINKSEAAKYFKMAADKGNNKAMFNYAIMLYQGDGIEVNKPMAARYFKMSADIGFTKSIFNYATVLKKGEGVPVNKSEAIYYYKMAINKGNTLSMFNYANMLLRGDGVDVNKSEAAKYYKMAADKGCAKAKFMYTKIMSVKQKSSNTQMAKKIDNPQMSKKVDNIQMSKKDDNIQMNEKIDHFDHFRKAFIQKDSHSMIKYATIIKNGSYSKIKSSDEMEINSNIDLCNYVNLIFNKIFPINSNSIEFQQCIQELCKIGALHPNQNQLTKLGLRMIPFYLIPPFVSSSILKVSDLYDFEISSIVGAIIYYIYSTENLYIKPITKSFCNNFCEDSDIITLTRTLFDIMTKRSNYDEAIIKSGFNPLKIKSIIKSINQISLMQFDYNEDIIWEKLKSFFNKNNMMDFIQKIINEIEEINPHWINFHKIKYNSIVKSSINYKFIYKNQFDKTIKINQRPGGLGLVTPGSCFIMQLQSNQNSIETIYYGSIIHRNISEEKRNIQPILKHQ